MHRTEVSIQGFPESESPCSPWDSDKWTESHFLHLSGLPFQTHFPALGWRIKYCCFQAVLPWSGRSDAEIFSHTSNCLMLPNGLHRQQHLAESVPFWVLARTLSLYIDSYTHIASSRVVSITEINTWLTMWWRCRSHPLSITNSSPWCVLLFHSWWGRELQTPAWQSAQSQQPAP